MYYNNKFLEYSKNSKKTWDTIREVLGKSKNKVDLPDYFKSNGSIITGTKNICEGFIEFFVEIGPKLAAKIPDNGKKFTDYLENEKNCNFKFNKVTNKMISDIAKEMQPKKSCGHDGISSKLLKDILPIIQDTLCHVFNLSLTVKEMEIIY